MSMQRTKNPKGSTIYNSGDVKRYDPVGVESCDDLCFINIAIFQIALKRR